MSKQLVKQISVAVGLPALMVTLWMFLPPWVVETAQGATDTPHPWETRSVLVAALGVGWQSADGCSLFRAAVDHQAATAARWAEKRPDDDALTANALLTARILIRMQDLDCR